MITFIKLFSLLFVLLYSQWSFAGYVRSIDVENYSLPVLNCYGEVSQRCIINVCLNSDERDCQDVCRQLAATRCKVDEDDWIIGWPD